MADEGKPGRTIASTVARPDKFRETDRQVNREATQITHGLHIIRPSNLRKTALQGRLALEFINSHSTGSELRIEHPITAKRFGCA